MDIFIYDSYALYHLSFGFYIFFSDVLQCIGCFILLFTVCACLSSANALPFYVQLCTIFSVLLCIDYAKIYILVYAYSFSFFVWRQYIHIDFSSPAFLFFQHKYCMRCSEYMIIYPNKPNSSIAHKK